MGVLRGRGPGETTSKRILVTTSRRTSPRVRSLVKDLAQTLPGAFKFTRGHYSMVELAREALLVGADRLVVISERRGNPGIIRVYDVDIKSGPNNIASFIVKGVSLARESRRGYPSLAGGEVLAARAMDSGVAAEFSDAFVLAFHARLYEAVAGSFVEARISSINSRDVIVEFYYGGRPVGPKLKLGKPAVMIKAVGRD
ncbi:MAG: hypothetical protein F7B20_06945 [Aeropyrum sp.]|nr:hypothetical protein [Aeropyrum sp.]MCE4616094.1 hypothetical protein [Aeropyrum sp.]